MSDFSIVHDRLQIGFITFAFNSIRNGRLTPLKVQQLLVKLTIDFVALFLNVTHLIDVTVTKLRIELFNDRKKNFFFF